jgi:energy-coupling factor transporter transmembrane protein EcfT
MAGKSPHRLLASYGFAAFLILFVVFVSPAFFFLAILFWIAFVLVKLPLDIYAASGFEQARIE